MIDFDQLSFDEKVVHTEARVCNYFRDRRVGTIRQIEFKVSECNSKPAPHFVTIALNRLLDAGKARVLSEQIDGYSMTLFAAGNFRCNVGDKRRLRDVLRWNGTFRDICANKRLAGDPLEDYIANAIDLAGGYEFLSTRRQQPLLFNGIPLGGRVDHIARSPGGIYLLIECKNYREWIYWDHPEFWQFVRKLARIRESDEPVLGVFVARKVTWLLRRVCQSLGVLALDTHHQLFDASAATILQELRRSDTLGFHDISWDLRPHGYVRQFFTKTVAEWGDEYADNFHSGRGMNIVMPHLDLLAESSRTSKQRKLVLKEIAKSLNLYEFSNRSLGSAEGVDMYADWLLTEFA
jgi:hypothetical protein